MKRKALEYEKALPRKGKVFQMKCLTQLNERMVTSKRQRSSTLAVRIWRRNGKSAAEPAALNFARIKIASGNNIQDITHQANGRNCRTARRWKNNANPAIVVTNLNTYLSCAIQIAGSIKTDLPAIRM